MICLGEHAILNLKKSDVPYFLGNKYFKIIAGRANIFAVAVVNKAIDTVSETLCTQSNG